MNLSIEQEMFAAAPPGNLHSIEEITICPSRDEAVKAAEEESEMSGQQMVVIPVKVLIPMTLVGGQLVIQQR